MPTAFVTGAGVRVGRAIAEALAEAGYDPRAAVSLWRRMAAAGS